MLQAANLSDAIHAMNDTYAWLEVRWIIFNATFLSLKYTLYTITALHDCTVDNQKL